MVNHEMMKVEQVAQYLRIARATVYKLLSEGQLPAFRLGAGGSWRFARADLDKWIQRRRVA